MSAILRVLLLLIFVDSGLHAQEIRYIDVPFAEQRTELRHPRGDCKEGMLCGGFGGGRGVCGGPPPRRPPASGAVLLCVDPTHKNTTTHYTGPVTAFRTSRVFALTSPSRPLCIIPP